MTNERCNTPGDLVVDGRRVATVRCELPPEHRDVTPHGWRLEWHDAGTEVADWPERDDPAEDFDTPVTAEGLHEADAVLKDAPHPREKERPWL